MENETILRHALSVHCPTCGAAPGEKCESSTGLPRPHAHLDRLLIAEDLEALGTDDH